MADLQPIARMLLIAGAAIFILGLVLSLAGKLPWIGRLPGDIYIKKENFTFYLPITTGILLSILISVVLHLISRR